MSVNKREFVIVEDGTTYNLPLWRVIDGKGIVETTDPICRNSTGENAAFYLPVTFVRGDKSEISGETEVFPAEDRSEDNWKFHDKEGTEYPVSEVKPQEGINGTTWYVKKVTTIPRVDGIVHETAIALLIHDLNFKNGLVPNLRTALAITHLEIALFELEERQRERIVAGTQGTYKK